MCSGQCTVMDAGQRQAHCIIEDLSIVHFQTINCASLPTATWHGLCVYRTLKVCTRCSTNYCQSTMTHTLDLWPWPMLVQFTDIRQIYGASHEADWGHTECMGVHEYVDVPYASYRGAEDRVRREGQSTLVMSWREQQQMKNMPFSTGTYCIISLTYIKSTELWLLSTVSERSLQ